MTTKCYRVVLKEYQKSVNDGYIVAQIEKGKIKSLEGIFTCDFLTSEISEDDTITIIYYVLSDDGRVLKERFRFTAELEMIELPITIGINLQSSLVYITTRDTIEDENQIRYYQTQIEHVKAISTFK